MEEIFLGVSRRSFGMCEELVKVGDVSHYYTNIGVAVVELVDTLKVGEEIAVKGATTNLTQVVRSIEIEHERVKEAGAGNSIGIKVSSRVREGDEVYKIHS